MWILLKSIKNLLKEPHTNFIQTLVATFKNLPFKEAKYLPIFLYGKIEFKNEGIIELRPTFLTPGLIKLGRTASGLWGNGGVITPIFQIKVVG